ncbi:outer membrane protein assembly factor BamC [Aliikangiella coralliicola]|uniref:outer membrane protein assembly factor BamC n=1 Tax=Aliikangiella coralliicola TaxID=2592383 RepID=UPI00143CD61F|nr:outer membrane protein assembly factor BamC [Aliikangiella coralliicola]
MNCFRKIILIILSAGLSACSYIYGEDGLIKDRTYDYLEAKQTKELVVPQELKQKARVDYTQVPAIGEKAKQADIGKSVRYAAPVQILAVLDNIREDKKAPNPAVFVQENIDILWQITVDLFVNNEINPTVVDKSQYFLNTGWVALDERGVWLGIESDEESDEFRAEFQVKIKPGVIRGENRIEVVRSKAQKYNDDSEQWENVPSFWQDSAEMLNLIISNYDKKVTEMEREKRGRAIAGFKVELAKDADNNAALVTATNREIVWEKLPRVLESVNFQVNDKDRRLMTYFVKYEVEEPGFFASLFNDEPEALPIEPGDYQVSLTDVGELTAVTFKDGQGAPLESSAMVKLFPILNKLFGDKR